jgi:pilus assembly protein CpaE
MDTKLISILVIDGDAASLNYLSVMLRKSNYNVITASLAREGLIAAWKDLPEFIIFDPILPDLSGLELVTRLRKDRRTAAIPCVALSSRQDSQDAVALLSAGCNEYLPKSGQTMPRLLELIPRLLQVFSAAPKKSGALVAFISAKGGTGTSSLCANIAMCLGSVKIETRVAVIDLVLPIGSIADIVGYDNRLNLVTVAMQDPAQITSEYIGNNLPRVPNWDFHLLAGSPDPDSANQLAVNHLERILQAVVESYDYILVDIGRALSRISLPIIQKADVVVLTVGTDLSTAILTKTVWEYLQKQGIDPDRLYAIQNRAVGLEGLLKTELEQMTGMQIRTTMSYMNGNFTLANNRHEPIIVKYPNDSSSVTLKQIAIEIAELCKRSDR